MRYPRKFQPGPTPKMLHRTFCENLFSYSKANLAVKEEKDQRLQMRQEHESGLVTVP